MMFNSDFAHQKCFGNLQKIKNLGFFIEENLKTLVIAKTQRILGIPTPTPILLASPLVYEAFCMLVFSSTHKLHRDNLLTRVPSNDAEFEVLFCKWQIL